MDDCQYTKPAGATWQGFDLAKAKQLVQESGTAGAKVTLITQDDEVNRAIGENVVSTLNQIGYQATVKAISSNIQFTYIQNTKNKVQISLTQWYQDYPAASDFLNVLLGCASFTPGSDSSINIAGFCDKAIQAKMDSALKTAQTDPKAADAIWAQVDQDVMTAAAVAPLITPKKIDFISKRVGNYQNAVSGFTCAWSAYLLPTSANRSAGRSSKTQSAWPFCTAVTAASTVWPNWYSIRST